PVFAVMSGLVLTKDFDDKALNVWLSVVTISLIFHIARYGFERYKVQGYALAVVLPLANLFLFAGSLLLVVLNGFRLYRRQTSPMSGKHCMKSEEHTSELQSRENIVCRLLLEKKKEINKRER